MGADSGSSAIPPKVDVAEDEARRDQKVEDMKEEADLYQGILVGNIAPPNCDISGFWVL